MAKITIDMDELVKLREAVVSIRNEQYKRAVYYGINDFIDGIVSMNACAEMCSVNKGFDGNEFPDDNDDWSLFDDGFYCLNPFIDKATHNEWMNEFYNKYFPDYI